MKLWKKGLYLSCMILMILFIKEFIELEDITGRGVVLPAKDVVENGDMDVYFCPGDNCEEKLVGFLKQGENILHCALFDLDLQSVVNVLNEKYKNNVDVKLVVDNNNLGDVKDLEFVRQDSNNQLMHNKFCVVDKKVFTGSFNPTERCAYKNNNNMILINSENLAKNYEDEFIELWKGDFGKGERNLVTNFIIGNITIKNYFCPEDDCEENVLNILKNAKKNVYFMVFSFTSDEIGDYLISRKDLNVKGVFEKRQAGSEYSEYKKMSGMNVKLDSNPANMHHKVFIIDEEIVITGSYNPTASGNNKNDENILVIYSFEIAEKYLKEFWKVYGN